MIPTIEVDQAAPATETQSPEEAFVPTGAEKLTFTPAECQEFQDDDKRAAGAVVGLLTGIFMLALVSYTSIVVGIALSDFTFALAILIGGMFFLAVIAFAVWESSKKMRD